MRRDQYFDNLRNLNLQQQEMERKWRVYLMEQEMMEMAKMSALNQPFSSGGGVLPQSESGPRAMILYPDSTWKYFIANYDEVSFLGPFDTGVDSSLFMLAESLIPIQNKGFVTVFKSVDPVPSPDPEWDVRNWSIQFITANGEILQTYEATFDPFNSDVVPILKSVSNCFVLGGVPTVDPMKTIVQIFDGEKIIDVDFSSGDGTTLAFSGTAWDDTVDGKIPIYVATIVEGDVVSFGAYCMTLQGEKILVDSNFLQYGEPIGAFGYERGGMLCIQLLTLEEETLVKIYNLKTSQMTEIDATDPTHGNPLATEAFPYGDSSCTFIFVYDDGAGGNVHTVYDYNGSTVNSVTVSHGALSSLFIRSSTYSPNYLRNFSSSNSMMVGIYTPSGTQSGNYLVDTDAVSIIYSIGDGNINSYEFQSTGDPLRAICTNEYNNMGTGLHLEVDAGDESGLTNQLSLLSFPDLTLTSMGATISDINGEIHYEPAWEKTFYVIPASQNQLFQLYDSTGNQIDSVVYTHPKPISRINNFSISRDTIFIYPVGATGLSYYFNSLTSEFTELEESYDFSNVSYYQTPDGAFDGRILVSGLNEVNRIARVVKSDSIGEEFIIQGIKSWLSLGESTIYQLSLPSQIVYDFSGNVLHTYTIGSTSSIYYTSEGDHFLGWEVSNPSNVFLLGKKGVAAQSVPADSHDLELCFNDWIWDNTQ